MILRRTIALLRELGIQALMKSRPSKLRILTKSTVSTGSPKRLTSSQVKTFIKSDLISGLIDREVIGR
jgi:hypothetical protein